MNDTFNIKKHVAKVLLSSSVLNKYKVKFKVCNKMLIGQNNNSNRTMYAFRVGFSHGMWIAHFILSWKVVEVWSRMLQHSSEQRVRHCVDVWKCERSYNWPSAHVRMWINVTNNPSPNIIWRWKDKGDALGSYWKSITKYRVDLAIHRVCSLSMWKAESYWCWSKSDRGLSVSCMEWNWK